MIEPISASNPTPGSLLRHQRQHIGWTVDEIANALCLSPDLIRSLEADDYENMGGSTFILGYLRAYARLVGVDIETAIVKHRGAIPEYVPDPDHLPPEARRERAKKRLYMRSATAAIAVLVVASGIVGAVLLWPARVKDDKAVRTDAGEELPAARQSPAAQTPVAPSEPPTRQRRLEAIEPADVREAVQSGVSVPVNVTMAGIAPAPVVDAAAPVQPASPEDARRHLVLLFDEGSWADVRDATGNRLLSQTVAKGSSVDLVGEPPFTVFLGNASGVRVKYLGRIQSYSQTKKGLFARFTVGREQ